MINVEYLKSWMKAGFLLACLLPFFSCSNEEDVTPVQLKEVRFCLADNEQTRATQDNFFENGDAVGVFAFVRNDNAHEATLDGEYANNKKWVWNGSQLLPASENDKIFFSGSKKIDFYAYYPYNRAYNDPHFIGLNCPNNQSSSLYFKKSDFLTAINKTGISNGIVSLNFKHRFSIIRLYVEDIGEEVLTFINPLMLSGIFDFSNNAFTLGGTPTAVKMLNKGSESGFLTFEACVPTQSLDGAKFMIQRVDGSIDLEVTDGILKEGEITTFGAGITKTITINPAAGGTTTGAGTYPYGYYVTVRAFPKMGYEFTGWKENGVIVSTSANYTFEVTKDRVLDPQFVTNRFVVALGKSIDKAGSVTGAGSYAYGQNCTISASVNPGYNFSYWDDNGDVFSASPTYTFPVTENKTLEAIYTAKVYTIDVVNGTIQGGGTTGKYYYGDKVTLIADTKVGSKFIRWSDGVTTSTRTITVTGNTTYTAEFSANTYKITVNQNVLSYGDVYGSGTYAYGSVANIRAVPRTTSGGNISYAFVNWSDGNTSSNRYVTVTGNATYTANFQKIEYVYSLTVTPTSMSFASGGGTKSFTVSSTRTKYVNGTASGFSEGVSYTKSITGSGFSLSGNSVVAADNNSTNIRSGTVTINQTGGKSIQISLEQEGKFNIDVDIQ